LRDLSVDVDQGDYKQTDNTFVSPKSSKLDAGSTDPNGFRVTIDTASGGPFEFKSQNDTVPFFILVDNTLQVSGFSDKTLSDFPDAKSAGDNVVDESTSITPANQYELNVLMNAPDLLSVNAAQYTVDLVASIFDK
tara:strand:- start:183 stop:590 length:408 start_codon:yes stop_codon:yes gene_type:complete